MNVFLTNDLMNFDNYNTDSESLIKEKISKQPNIIAFFSFRKNLKIIRLIKEYLRAKSGRGQTLVESDIYQQPQIKKS